MRKPKEEIIPICKPKEATPLVSIITPAYNAQPFLQDTIDSVLAQTYQNWELIIVVDIKCKDDTAKISLEAGAKDSRIKVVQDQECNSLSANRNKAIDLANGYYIAFLDSDDRWLPSKLETQVKAMQERNMDISYHSFSVIDEKGLRCGPTRLAKYDVGFNDLLKNNCIGCLTVMVKKDFVSSHRMKDVRHEDLDFWLQLLRDGALAMSINVPLAEYRIRKSSVSKNKLKCAVWRWQLYRHLGISTPRSFYLMLLYALFAVKKRM